METGKLLTLGALGASAATAIAAPIYSFATDAPTEVLPPYDSSLFNGLKHDSTDLYRYPTFNNQDCIKKAFPALENTDSIRNPITGTAEGSEFKIPPLNSSGVGESFLCLYLKQYRDSTEKKGNVVATIEMASNAGSYGIIMMNSITNMLNDGGYSFDYRVLFLDKKSGKWKIEAGVQWSDPLFMGDAKPERLKLQLLEGVTFNEIFWKNRLCKLSKSCEEELEKKTKDEKPKSVYEWKTKSSTGRNIFRGLRIESLDAVSGAPKPDFWNGDEIPLTKDSTVATKPTAIFVDGQWKATKTPILDGKIDQLQSWFKKFRDDKGEWSPK